MGRITNNFNGNVKTVNQDYRRFSQRRRSPHVADTNVKLPEEDKRELQEIIKQEGYTMSGYMREAYYIARLFSPEVRARILAEPQKVKDLFS